MVAGTCQVCGKEFKHLGAHTRFAHKPGVVENSSSAQSPPVREVRPTRFVSTRSPGLTVIIRPTRRGFINTNAGHMSTVMEGKRVSFHNGELETTDPEVIEYLTSHYKDAKYPVTNITAVEDECTTKK